MKAAQRPRIFEVLDWKKILEQMMTYQQLVHKGSARDLVRKAGLKSPGYLTRLLQGERQISGPVAKALAKALDFSAMESLYFQECVQWSLVTDPEKREQILRKLLKLQKKYAPSSLNADQFHFYSTWFIPIVYEAIEIFNLPKEKSNLIRALEITAKEYDEAMEVLQDLKIIEKENSRWVRCHSHLETPSEVQSLAVRRFHLDLLKIANDKVSQLPASKRLISGMTIRLTETEYQLLKTEAIHFLTEMANRFEQGEKDATKVYQFELLLFPFMRDLE